MSFFTSLRFRKYSIQEDQLQDFSEKYDISLEFLQELYSVGKLILEPILVDQNAGNNSVEVEKVLLINSEKLKEQNFIELKNLAQPYNLHIYKSDGFLVTKLSEEEIINHFAKYSDFINDFSGHYSNLSAKVNEIIGSAPTLEEIDQSNISFLFGEIQDENKAKEVLNICKELIEKLSNSKLLAKNKEAEKSIIKALLNQKPLMLMSLN